LGVLSKTSITTALAEFGITKCRLTQLASRHNDVFRVDVSPRRRFVLRIQNDLMNDAQARSQLDWLESLARDPDVKVPAPLRTRDGRPFTHLSVGADRRRAVLLRWLAGQTPRTRDDRFYRAAAGMIAKLHDHSEAFRPSRGFVCRRLDGDWLFGDRFFVRAANSRKHLTSAQRKVASRTEKFVRAAMKSLGQCSSHFGVIHADLNLDNIVFHRGRPSPIDFDEFGLGWYLFDLAELIRTSITPQNVAERKQLVIEAYTAHRPLDKAEIGAFDAFLAATFVQYLDWAFGHARSDRDLRWVKFCMEVLAGLVG
jgi:Ser/Thr protein kinase RdoA (MazF antagonist)